MQSPIQASICQREGAYHAEISYRKEYVSPVRATRRGSTQGEAECRGDCFIDLPRVEERGFSKDCRLVFFGEGRERRVHLESGLRASMGSFQTIPALTATLERDDRGAMDAGAQ